VGVADARARALRIGRLSFMDATTRSAKHAVVEDVQGHADTRQLPINRVGIKDITHPVRVKDRSAGEQHTIATFNMYVNLPHHFKGTHMSRFVEILNRHEREIGVE
jgi:GTP cyclohydrolase IB